MDGLVTMITNCARCGGDHHRGLDMKPLSNSQHWTHFAICPAKKEPILIKIYEADEG